MLAVYRIGAYIPTPGIDTNRFEQFFTQNAGGFLGYFDLFSGGMLRRMTIFALGITPYITASIILQLLTVVIPTLDKLQKEGELGRRKITQWTRYLTVGLAIIQSIGIALALQNSDGNFVLHPGFGFIFMTTLTFTTGTSFIMWLGEQITDRGIGNGMSLIIFVGIVVGLPERGHQHLQQHLRHASVESGADGDHPGRDGGGGRLHRVWWSAANGAFPCSTPSELSAGA